MGTNNGNETGTYGSDFGPEFQRHVLAVCARHPDFALRFRSALDYTFFAASTDKVVAKALLAHVDEHRAVPTRTTLIEQVRKTVNPDKMDGVETLVKVLYKDDISDADAVAKIAIDFGKQQAMCNAVLEAADDVDKGKRQKVMPRIQKALMVGEDLSNVGLDLHGDLDRALEWYLNPEDDRQTIPTGIPHLDYAMSGGLGRRELGVVLAPPKRGKSITLANFAFGASAAGYNVVYYTCEMSERKVMQRLHARLMGKDMALRKKAPQEFTERLRERTKLLVKGRVIFKEYPTRTATASMLRSHLSILASDGFHPDLIIVDYADIMQAERRLGEMRHEQASLYEDIRQLAGEYNAASWTASQSTTAGFEKETLTMGDFAEAREKAAIMDVGIAFCQTDTEKVERKARLFMMGMRDVEDGGIVHCHVNKRLCYVTSEMLTDAAQSPVYVSDVDDLDEHDRRQTEYKEMQDVAKKAARSRKVKAKAGLKSKRPRKQDEDSLPSKTVKIKKPKKVARKKKVESQGSLKDKIQTGTTKLPKKPKRA